MDNVVSKDSFSAEKVSNEKILFWGLSAGSPIWDKTEFSRYSSIALASLTNRRKDIDVSHNSNLATDLGELKYHEIYQNNRAGEILNSETLSIISSVTKDYRYILLSRIDRNHINETSDYQDGKSMLITIRELTIHTEVYDLKDLEIVWSGNNSLTRSNEKTNKLSNSGSASKDMTDTAIENKLYGTHPPPPPIEKMIERSFAELADSLPNTPCSDMGFIHCIKQEYRKNK